MRVVFDRKNQLKSQHKVVFDAKTLPLWVFSKGNHPQKAALDAFGVRFLPVSGENDVTQLEAAVEILAQQGITRLLVEAGAKLSTVFLQSGLINRIYWFRAPLLLGNEGLAGIGGGFPAQLSDATRWALVEQHSLGPDQLDVFACLPGSLPISAS